MKNWGIKTKNHKNLVVSKKCCNFAKKKGGNNENDTSTAGGLRQNRGRRSEKNAGIASIFDRIRKNSGNALARPQSEKSEQEKWLKEYAEIGGLLFSKKSIAENLFKELPPGKEAKVFLDKDGKNVIKIVNYTKYSDTPLSFYDNRIVLFGELFPATSYQIVGFLEDENGLSFVVKQPFIHGKTLQRIFTENIVNDFQSLNTQQNRVKEYMQNKFSMEVYGLDAFADGSILVQDLHLKNVIEGIDGNLYVIDAVPSRIDNVPCSGRMG